MPFKGGDQEERTRTKGFKAPDTIVLTPVRPLAVHDANRHACDTEFNDLVEFTVASARHNVSAHSTTEQVEKGVRTGATPCCRSR